MSSFMDFLTSHFDELMGLLYDHTWMTLAAVFFAILIGIPLGILISSVKGTDKPILGLANIMQAIPSLAALGLLVPFIGIGSPPAILMVVLYSLLPILKNTYTGITNINPQTIEAAYGIGMTHAQVLFRIKLPLALPVIMSGVRIASVTAVGLMTIAAYIGAGGLGNYVISGIQTSNVNQMLCGAIPACILALLMDFVMSRVEKAVVPISLSVGGAALTKEAIHRGKVHKRITLSIVGVLLLVLVGVAVVPSLMSDDDMIVVSSKPAVEQNIMGHMIAEVIEEKTDLKVEKKLDLGASPVIYNAIKAGEVDIYPEYSGSIYGAVFGKFAEPGTPPEKIIEDSRAMLAEDDIYYGEMYGVNNRYALGVLPEFAEKYNIKTISDLENLSKTMPLVLACDQEYPSRADGIPALKKVYPGLQFEKYLQFQGTLMYDALINEEVDVMTPYTTDALLKKFNITILEDDKGSMSNYHLATVIRMDTLEKHPELKDALGVLEHNISDEEMMSMNYEVVVNGRGSAEVAHEFLVNKGIVEE